jgi:hypothetical protein
MGTAEDAARELAKLIADAAARSGGKPGGGKPGDWEAAKRLLARLTGEMEATDTFLPTLAAELRARDATLPPLDQVPAQLAPLLAAVGMILPGLGAGAGPGVPGQKVDLDAVNRRLERAVGAHLGVSPRKAREEATRNAIRERIAAQVAESMRKRGLKPKADFEAEQAAAKAKKKDK